MTGRITVYYLQKELPSMGVRNSCYSFLFCLPQQRSAYFDVYVLHALSNGTSSEKIFMVEEIHDCNSIGKFRTCKVLLKP